MLMRQRQQIQYGHDFQNHLDILCLSRIDRLKHYGLHFAKYAGRLARGDAEAKSRTETLVDAFLVILSAANALNQSLSDFSDIMNRSKPIDLAFTDQAGRFADACEKIDHLEDFREIALDANAALAIWVEHSAVMAGLDIDDLIGKRRKQLAQRAVYSPAF